MKLMAQKLSFSYDGKHVLWENVSLSVATGEIFSILGANGAGKSTLLRCLIGFLPPRSGRVWIEDDDGTVYDAQEDARAFAKRIGYVPQMQNTSYSFTVRDYVVMGRAPYLRMFQKPGTKDYALADEVLREMNIYDIRERAINTLSGGQQRQAAIARAIVQEPQLILMDEPTNHLDYGNQFRVVEMIRQLSKRGMAVLLTTHLPDQAIYLGGQAGIVTQNTLIVGNAHDVITEERLRDLYHMNVQMVYVPEAGRKLCIPGEPGA